MNGITMTDDIALSTFDPVDIVMQTDTDIDKAMAEIEVDAATSAEDQINKLYEAGVLKEGDVDDDEEPIEADDSPVDEGYDFRDVIGIALEGCSGSDVDDKDDPVDEGCCGKSSKKKSKQSVKEGDCGSKDTDDEPVDEGTLSCAYDDFFDEDGDLIDQALSDDDEPESKQDQNDNDMIDAALSGEDINSDNTGTESTTESTMDDEWGSCIFESSGETTDISEDDDEAINEDIAEQLIGVLKESAVEKNTLLQRHSEYAKKVHDEKFVLNLHKQGSNPDFIKLIRDCQNKKELSFCKRATKAAGKSEEYLLKRMQKEEKKGKTSAYIQKYYDAGATQASIKKYIDFFNKTCTEEISKKEKELENKK